MTSLKPLYRPRFADALAKGDVFSLCRTGTGPVVTVTDDPVTVRNFVGSRRLVRLTVCLLDTTDEGDMYFAPSNVVYVRTEEI